MRQCMDCGADLVIAPSGQRVLAAHPEMRTICIDCVLQARKSGEVSKVEPAPGAIDELVEDIVTTVIEHARKAAKARDN